MLRRGLVLSNFALRAVLSVLRTLHWFTREQSKSLKVKACDLHGKGSNYYICSSRLGLNRWDIIQHEAVHHKACRAWHSVALVPNSMLVKNR